MAGQRNISPRRLRLAGAILAAVAMVFTTALVGQPANAEVTLKPKGKVVTPINADVRGSCKLVVNRVAAGGATTITLTASAHAAGFDGYRANRYTQIFCYLLPAGTTDPAGALFSISPSANGFHIFPKSGKATIPYAPSYALCSVAWTKLQNGDSSFTPYVCA
jgi:hypothetical protein